MVSSRATHYVYSEDELTSKKEIKDFLSYMGDFHKTTFKYMRDHIKGYGREKLKNLPPNLDQARRILLSRSDLDNRLFDDCINMLASDYPKLITLHDFRNVA